MSMPVNSWPDHFSPTVVRGAHGSSALSSLSVALEAWRRGLTVTFHSHDLEWYSISSDEQNVRFNFARPDSITSQADTQVMARKWDTNRALEASGVPVPKGVLLAAGSVTEQELREQADTLGYPLVLKPNRGSMGRGVLVNLRTWEELKAGFDHLVGPLGKKEVLMETHHEGDDHRLLVIGDRMVAAARRVPANVTGDGEHTISELIRLKNKSRAGNPFLSTGPIKVDYEVLGCLREQGLEPDTVPSAGRYIYLRKIANASAGGDVIDVTDDMPDEVKDAAVRAVQAIPRTVIAGVDVLYGSDTLSNTEYTIIELNPRPHIGVNMYPSVGTGPDVPRAYIDYLFPTSSRRELPGDRLLKFNLQTIREPLRTGVADGVTVANLPDHDFPYRRRFRLQEGANTRRISRGQRRNLLAIARRDGVAGYMRPVKEASSKRKRTFLRTLRRRLLERSIPEVGSAVEVVLAGADEQSTRRMRVAISKHLGALDQGQEWRRVLTTGFSIDPALVSSAGRQEQE
ncbi:hypothetical protein [Pseudactinotalea sp. Z1748]|uniref:hypothetical protein n=1 Tax=Pseudactinotalea sp. Z1748 TaxID=3413027 RepID=UPI003C79E8D7